MQQPNITLIPADDNLTNYTNNTDPCYEAIEGEYDLGLHIMALFLVLFSSWFGCSLPVILVRFPSLVFMQRVLYWCRFFGAGVILSTGFVHIYPDAVQTLSDPCLPEWFSEKYPASAGLFAMLAAIVMHLVEWLAATHVQKKHFSNSDEEEMSERKGGASTSSDDHSHGLLLEHKTRRISTYVLEFGISIHSVIIGVALGISVDEFTPFMIAIIFHQMFEGMGLGGMISELQFEKYPLLYMGLSVLLYSISTPVGVAIGIGINGQGWNATNQLLATGILDAIASGVLIYTSLVTMIVPMFKSKHFEGLASWNKTICFLCFYAGAGVMSTLAIWA